MKSTNSRRKVSLTYLKNQDFWSFYMANKEDVDYIIDASCRMFKNIVPTEDMRLDILIKLYRSRFLERYDATKAQLNTYITSLVRGHAKTIAELERPDLFKEEPVFTRVLDAEFNAGTSENLNLAAPEEEGPADMDKRFLRRLGARLDKPYRKLFNLVLLNKTNMEISKQLGCSRPLTFWRCNTMVEKLRNMAGKELAIHGYRKGSKVKIVGERV